jgi:hypothetical protein
MLLAAAVAFNAIVEFADAFLDMFATNIVGRVFVTAVAGVARIFVAQVAADAARIVVAIKHKKFAMVEGRRSPSLLRVALNAVASNLSVQRVDRWFVTGLTLVARFLF